LWHGTAITEAANVQVWAVFIHSHKKVIVRTEKTVPVSQSARATVLFAGPCFLSGWPNMVGCLDIVVQW